MKKLEENLLSLIIGKEHVWYILNILRPKIRRKILRKNRIITS